jgi:hypothetical protein
MMNARVTQKHTLFIDQIQTTRWIVPVPWSEKMPGTWIGCVLEGNSLVPGGWIDLGFGTYQESFKEKIYDIAIKILNVEAPVPIAELKWV